MTRGGPGGVPAVAHRAAGSSSPSSAVPPSSRGSPVLPEDALSRLQALSGAKVGSPLFTSDLSVSEFFLVRQAGFMPLGIVFGSSIHNVGLGRRGRLRSGELSGLTQAMYSAREQAMARLEAEADLLGADGVVGVRLEVNFRDWGRGLAEFLAMGTAVAAADRTRAEGSWRRADGKPFTSDLTGQDFWTLARAGYAPVGLVMGTCVYHVGYRSPAIAVATAMRSAELPHFTQALYESRELAMSRLREEARSFGAEGVVGVKMIERSHQWGSHVVELLAVGTAVRQTDGEAEMEPPVMVLTLDK